MPTSPDIPLHLYQVLEEEYLNLHGELSFEEEINLHDQTITARLDWQFHSGHLKAPAKLADKLGRESEIAKHLRTVSPQLKQFLAEYGEAQKSAHLESAFNGLLLAFNELLEQTIYSPEAFKYVPLKESTRKLVELYEKAADKPAGALAHLNRLLLEEVFPNEVVAISDIRLTAMYQRLHREKQAAICLSGGGIRSGTFALGLLQRLAHFNLLKEFHYLSTVSGGGYIGSWLTAWLHRHPEGMTGVTRDMKNLPPRSKIDPDALAIRHLREFSNFLTPKVGFLTADTWAFIAIYLRNLFLNWLVLIPLLIVVLALPRLYVALTLGQSDFQRLIAWMTGGSVSSRLITWITGGPVINARHVFLVLGGALLVLALTYLNLNRPTVSEQLIERSPFWRKRRKQGSFLRWCLLPLVCAAICLTTYWAWSRQAQSQDTASRIKLFIAFGAAIPFLAFVFYSFVLKRYQPKYWKEFNRWELLTLLLLLASGVAGGALARWATKTTWGGTPIVDKSLRPWVTELYACFAVPSLLLLVLLATTLFIGLVSRSRQFDDEDREWWARFKAWVLIAIMGWSIFSALSIFGPLLLFWDIYGKTIASAGGISGLIALLAAQSGKTPANDEQAAGKGGLLKSIINNHILPLMALLFLVVFLILISFGTSGIIYGLAVLAQMLPARFGAGLAGISPPLDADGHMSTVHYPGIWLVSGFIVALSLLVTALGNLINLNKFSLHAAYRDRLIRAYLGASRGKSERSPNPFTGFDPGDNIQMHELRPALLHENDFTDIEGLAVTIHEAQDKLSAFIKEHLSDTVRDKLGTYNPITPLATRDKIDLIEDINRILESEAISVNAQAAEGESRLIEIEPPRVPAGDQAIIRKRAVLAAAYPQHIKGKYPPPHRLLHVVNLALNLVGGQNLAWQQRKAETFAVTPLHAGCFRVGYRKSRYYGGEDGISLGTAATISGAAASSNMGYYTSSPLLSFVLTIFNVRLGWWLGNPGPAGDKTFPRSSPRLSVLPIIQEAFGLTDDTNKYVYLSDGGHFENLALYEMVLRRCHIIVVSDGAQDENYEFGDLGNAVRKIRIDLGVPIKFDSVPIYKTVPENKQGRHWAFGRICYSEVDGDDVEDGVLIYIKPAVYGREPRDVLQYKKSNKEFPHQSTGDQFFDEPQLESYRMLGSYIMEQICANALGPNGAPTDLSIGQFVNQAYKNYQKADSPDLPQLQLNWVENWIRRRL
ncbi:MAG: hypothetical protein ACR2G4_04470 [Pyrinomonadaceae bacterium]